MEQRYDDIDPSRRNALFLSAFSAIGLLYMAIMNNVAPVSGVAVPLSVTAVLLACAAISAGGGCAGLFLGRGNLRSFHLISGGVLLTAFTSIVATSVLDTPTPWALSFLPLILVAAGAVLTQSRWYLLVLALFWAQYLAVVSFDDGSWRGWSTSLLLATIVSAGLHATRVRSHKFLLKTLGAVTETSLTDPLTHIGNRRGILTTGDSILAHCRRTNVSVTVFFCDVEQLKPVNDTYGHDAGDALIRGVAQALTHVVRDGDYVGRWGGDEFVVIAISSYMSAQTLSKRLMSYLKTHPPVDEHWWTPRVTAGQAQGDASQVVDLEELVEQADMDMYRRRQKRKVRDR